MINDHKTPMRLRVHSRDKVMIMELNLENGKFS